MSGIFTLAARLSTGDIISKRCRYGVGIGHKLMNEEQFFLKFFTTFLEGEKGRLILNNKDEVVDHYKNYNYGISIVSPYQYGFTFIDFIDKTVDHYNIDGRINKTNSFILQNAVILPFLNEYIEHFKTTKDDFMKIIPPLLENNFKYVELSNFLYAYQQGDLNAIFINKDGAAISKPYDLNFNEIIGLFIKNMKNNFDDKLKDMIPFCFSHTFPGLKVNYNENDIDLDKIREIKKNLTEKNFLNNGDLAGWDLYEMENI